MSENRHPPATAPRLDSLDVIRGVAILLILLMNIPFMGNTGRVSHDPRVLGWDGSDQVIWWFTELFLDGTQRGLLELLFGASALLITRNTARPTDPVLEADIYYRRALWLMLFGLIHGTLLLWPGDILLLYGMTGLFLFPFRNLSPRILLACGVAGTLLLAASAAPEWLERYHLEQQIHRIEAAPAGVEPSTEDRALQEKWQEVIKDFQLSPELWQQERTGRTGSYPEALSWAWKLEKYFNASTVTVGYLAESLSTALIGMALFKWGVTQAGRSRRFYLLGALVGYGIGVTVNYLEIRYAVASGFSPTAMPEWSADFGRLPVTFGHLCLICLVLKTASGHRLLSIFKATGRMALSCYVAQTLIHIVLFPGFTLGLWGRFGWTQLWMIAGAIQITLIIACHLWLRQFDQGPLEALMRRLVQGAGTSRQRHGAVNATS